MNFSPGLKCNFLKRAFFPIRIKANKTPTKPKFDLFIRSSFFLTLGKSYYSLSHFFDIGKIIEDEINKSNDPLFKIWENSNMKITKSPTLSEGPWVVWNFLDRQNARKYDMHDDLMYNIPNWKFGMLQTYPP